MFVFVLPAMDEQAVPGSYSPHDERLSSLRQTAIGKQGKSNARKQSSFVVDLQSRKNPRGSTTVVLIA